MRSQPPDLEVLQLEGFPAGTYRWSSQTAGGGTAGGEFALAPGNQGPIELVVP